MHMNMLKIFFLLSLLFSHALMSLEYGLCAKKVGTVPIDKVFVFSERCSGNHYIESLILSNFSISLSPFCHKHFPPWYELSPEHYRGDPRHYSFAGTEKILFIVIFRDPYDWVRSFHLDPWHAKERFPINLSFAEFIRRPWILDEAEPENIQLRQLNPLMDCNPIDGKPFKNVFQLRTAKIRTMLKIKERAHNVYYINYETVRDHPKEVLSELEKFFKLSPTSSYHPVVFYKADQRQGVYKQKKYQDISNNDLHYINSQLNEKLENKIGYKFR